MIKRYDGKKGNTYFFYAYIRTYKRFENNVYFLSRIMNKPREYPATNVHLIALHLRKLYMGFVIYLAFTTNYLFLRESIIPPHRQTVHTLLHACILRVADAFSTLSLALSPANNNHRKTFPMKRHIHARLHISPRSWSRFFFVSHVLMLMRYTQLGREMLAKKKKTTRQSLAHSTFSSTIVRLTDGFFSLFHLGIITAVLTILYARACIAFNFRPSRI